MPRPPLLAAALAMLLPTSAHAVTGGCNLRWDQCYGDAGVQNKSFACDTNSGSETLVASFVLSADMEDARGIEPNLEFATASATVPGWWQFQNAGTCRTHSLTASGSVLDPGAPSNCPDWAQGIAAGGLAAVTINSNGYGANTIRLVLGFAIAATVLNPLSNHQEYFALRLTLNHAKTVGTGACAGCTTPDCIVFNRIDVVQDEGRDVRTLTGPTNGVDSDYATWQGGAGVISALGSGCPAAAPTRRSTWRSLKSLYR